MVLLIAGHICQNNVVLVFANQRNILRFKYLRTVLRQNHQITGSKNETEKIRKKMKTKANFANFYEIMEIFHEVTTPQYLASFIQAARFP